MIDRILMVGLLTAVLFTRYLVVGWEKLESALEINDAGSVAGVGVDPIARSGLVAYSLTPE